MQPLVIGLVLSMAPNAVVSAAASQTKTARARRLQKSKPKLRVDYSQFSHRTHVDQQKLACDSCHTFPTKNWDQVRKGDAAFQDVAEFPVHASCLNCHRTHFFARERPAPAICSNCHINVTPRDTARFLFPSLGDVADTNHPRRSGNSEFVINFPHDKHIDVVGLINKPRSPFVTASWQEKTDSTEPKSCPVCHQTYQPQGDSSEEYVVKPPVDLGDNFWLKKGTFKTAPNSHTVCFSCHNTDAGIPPAPSECNTCHKLHSLHVSLKTDLDPKLIEPMAANDRTIARAWAYRISSGTYRHEGGEHPNLSCLKCHDVAVAGAETAKLKHVSIRNCGGAEGCHVTATADEGGILNYEIGEKKSNPEFVCTKCHIVFGRQTVPASHLAAIPQAK